jgi:hypothetical protein
MKKAKPIKEETVFADLSEVSGLFAELSNSVDGSDNPYAKVKYVDDIRVDYPNEIGAIVSGLKARRANEEKRRKLATNPEYWFTVCFQSMEQKDVFLRKMGWDIISDKYIDGKALAKLMDIKLPSDEPNYQLEKSYKRIVDEVGTLGKGGEE